MIIKRQTKRMKSLLLGLSSSLLLLHNHVYTTDASNTTSPTMSPTTTPSSEPTIKYTSSPTSQPTYPITNSPTNVPTFQPSSTPTQEQFQTTPTPTTSPTNAPTTQLIGPIIQKDMTMNLVGIDPFTTKNYAFVEKKTKGYIQKFYNDVIDDGFIDLRDDLYGVKVSITIRRIDPPYVDPNELVENGNGSGDGNENGNGGDDGSTRHARHLRQLQTKQVTITYDQSISYRILSTATNQSPNIGDIAITPFNNISRRRNYRDILKNGGNDAFENLVEIKEPKLPVQDDPNNNNNDDGLNQNDVGTRGAVVAIIIGVGSTVVFILIIGGAYWWWNKNKKKNQQYDASHAQSGSGSYPNNVQVNGTARDEVSTLVDPESRNGIINNAASLAGYGTQSIGTVDYDYVKAYGGGTGDKSVSTAGGTIGDATRQTRYSTTDSSQYTGTMLSNQMNALHAAGGGGRGGGGNSAIGGGPAAMYMEEPSFQEHLRNTAAAASTSQIREEIVDVFAPPGRLGIVIDTPNDGAPVIHNLKDTCPIADQLRVGDKLIKVDDEDVRSMTAIKVSKLISDKSHHPTRKFTLTRIIT